MRPDRPSRTAEAAAFLRALHRVTDEPPPVLDDPLAVAFLPDYQRRFLARLARLPAGWLNTFRQRRSALGSMRAQILVRARYAEDALGEARAGGAVRYVILAAGLDSFALRRAEPGLAVVEVDHPATQRWKRDILSRRGHTLPESLSFVPVDFEQQKLSEALPAPDGPQFVSWLGTTYYLTRAAVAETLRSLAAQSPPGSRLVLDYWRRSPPSLPGAALLWSTRLATALQQEPMRCFIEPGDAEAFARQAGWRVREHLAPEIQNERYLRGRGDDLAVPAFAYLLQLER